MAIELGKEYTFLQFLSDVNYFEKRYLGIFRKYIIGYSCDGREIILLKIGCGPTSSLCTAGIRGSDNVNPAVLMKIAESYCETILRGEEILDLTGISAVQDVLPGFDSKTNQIFGAEEDMWRGFYRGQGEGGMTQNTAEGTRQTQCIWKLLSENSIFMMPILNPDGYVIAQEGFGVIRNPRLRAYCESFGVPYYAWDYNARGIDLSRNFPTLSQIYDYDGKMETEIETDTLIRTFQEVQPDGYLEYQVPGMVIYNSVVGLDSVYQERQEVLAAELSHITGYQKLSYYFNMAEELNRGTAMQYYAENYGGAAIVIRTLSPESRPIYDVELQPETYRQIFGTPAVFTCGLE